MGYVPEQEHFFDADETRESAFGNIELWSRVERITVYGAAVERNPTTYRLFEDDGGGGLRPTGRIRAWLDDNADDLHADLYRPRIDPFDKYEAVVSDWRLSVKFKRQKDRDLFVDLLRDMSVAR